ncbi:hypothetical protein GPECTOR_1g245 [Gonium pectorale]|uniref:Uncharacterized protein n=1 Tax=Gonium pectorale TaxID=33097 RepID=A0A150H403_GONPE|nr:hypothetical protein GPECTOR_1g245 [Gonium pectorale]|eukprot:KXZ56280.1 hypothetical protein GPECTOR_1g245 [Gonium pectorale]
MSQTAMQEAAKVALKDASRFLFFNEQGTVLVSSFTVHRHHPPLVYGRTMGGVPEESEGCAVCKVEKGLGGQACYGLITYQ